ncbi:M14 family zinc carboxypeptidase [Paenibacillus sp. SGZ-1009]|uniref:M14 family zinc carboxypeptidase n=1 Tax=Paenibacillus campi TaxID=3106031 RepID=UPI002AFEE345|nr:M14 family zinc carboxypeptidase [Paenibacillus sp. SGZ-1009]
MKKLLLMGFSLLLLLTSIPLHPVSAAGQIVAATTMYTYERMTRDIQTLAQTYPDIIQYRSIGKTTYGRDIWAIGLGKGAATIFINGSHHAREWLTTTLNMTMIEQYAAAYAANRNYAGYNARAILERTTIWFVPMVNPDGVTLQQFGLSAFPASVHSALIRMNGGSSNFKRWKANPQGIDLNRQYDSYWATLEDNIAYPFWRNHKGTAPVQTPENQALVRFTHEIDPEIAVSYHSAGRIIYWSFHTLPANLPRDRRLANLFSSMTGYRLMPQRSDSSGGGYTDWFITTFHRPAFTPEIGIKPGETNLPLAAFAEEWRRNQKIGLSLAQEGYSLWSKRNLHPVRTVSVRIDGQLPATDIKAFVQTGVNYVAYKPLLEQYGFTAFWDQSTRTVTATASAAGTVSFTLGSSYAQVNGKTVTLSGKPIMTDGFIYVPARLISQVTGAALAVDRKSGQLNFTSPKPATAVVPPTEAQQPPEAANVPGETTAVEGAATATVEQSTYGN